LNVLEPAPTVSLLDDIRELEACRVEWEELLTASAADRPMLSPLWLLSWWRTFGGVDGRRLCTWTFRVKERLVGLVPMLLRRHRHFGVLPMRRLELLGNGERESDEIMSEYLGPIVARGYEDAVADALVGQLASEKIRWQEMVLSGLDGDAPAVVALVAALSRQGWPWELGSSTCCPFIKLPSRWDDYLSGLSRNHRSWANRSMRSFRDWAGSAWRLDRAVTDADLARGRTILVELHGQRWIKDGRPGVFTSPLFLRFHDEVMPRLLDQKALDLCWLSVRGRPIAVLYNIVWRNRIYFYQSGRAVDVPKDIRPGVVLHLEAIKRAIEEGREEYDFLGGAARYKMQLASNTHPLVSIRIVRPGLAETARNLLEGGRAILRDMRRQRPTKTNTSE
jgi:CelD/BcsL family acetyltransferase involved in cellulose biosynthesis